MYLLSRGDCHVMVVSDRYRAETGYQTRRIHPLLTVYTVYMVFLADELHISTIQTKTRHNPQLRDTASALGQLKDSHSVAWNGDDDLADVSTCGCSRPCREIRLCFWSFSPSYVARLSCLAVCLFTWLGGSRFSSRRLAVFGSCSRLLLHLVVCLTALLKRCCSVLALLVM